MILRINNKIYVNELFEGQQNKLKFYLDIYKKSLHMIYIKFSISEIF